MLLVESDRARLLRSLILDIVIDVVNKKAGGSTKYINQRDEDYLITLYTGENYRKDFIEALKNYVDMGNFKYAIYTNKIYKSIFGEHAREYRHILNLNREENVRDTMYSEVLTTISMYETGLAYEIKKESEKKGRKLTTKEVDQIFINFENNPAWKPQIEVSRRKMASCDYAFRSVTHPELISYISPLNKDNFENILVITHGHFLNHFTKLYNLTNINHCTGAALSLIKISTKNIQLCFWNDTKHLS